MYRQNELEIAEFFNTNPHPNPNPNPNPKMWETIRHDRVDLSLARLSIPRGIIDFIRSTLTHARIRFRTPENGVTGYVPLERGLKPDDPLSQMFVQVSRHPEVNV